MPDGDYIVTIAALPEGTSVSGDTERPVTLEPGASVDLAIDFRPAASP
jgi:hypothetical protein